MRSLSCARSSSDQRVWCRRTSGANGARHGTSRRYSSPAMLCGSVDARVENASIAQRSREDESPMSCRSAARARGPGPALGEARLLRAGHREVAHALAVVKGVLPDGIQPVGEHEHRAVQVDRRIHPHRCSCLFLFAPQKHSGYS